MYSDLETLCVHAIQNPEDAELQQIAREVCCIAGAHAVLDDPWSRSQLTAVVDFVVGQLLTANAHVGRTHAVMLEYLALALQQIEARGHNPLPESLAFAVRSWSRKSRRRSPAPCAQAADTAVPHQGHPRA
jgi:hypothetical protein